MGRATGFDEATKAAIYARDRGVCAFSGKSLWALDWGASYLWEMDWTDFLRTPAQGGRPTPENGLCASYSMHGRRRDGSRDVPHFFRAGRPTADFFRLAGCISEPTARARRPPLEPSDWFFNRALSQVLIAVEGIVFGGRERARRRMASWTRSAEKKLGQWRSLAGAQAFADLQRRGLVPASPTRDQRLLIALRNAPDARAIEATIRELVPFYAESCSLIEQLARVRSPAGAERLLRRLPTKQRVSPALKRLVRNNAELLFGEQ